GAPVQQNVEQPASAPLQEAPSKKNSRRKGAAKSAQQAASQEPTLVQGEASEPDVNVDMIEL
ncbi:MAG: hypothetical protein Q4C50_10370, partial [Eubacteriales bacterium]|nr:hypothetical protein [Eubacteriales bacterium]